LIWREAKREYLDLEKTMDVFLTAVFFGLAGARLGYIILNPDKFGLNILRMLLPTWTPGFYLYGGLLAFGLSVYLTVEKKDIDLLSCLDVFTPGVILGAVFYKIGQFFDGSLVGIPLNNVLALPVAGEEGKFFPVSLLQAFLYFLIFVFIMKKRNYFLVKRKIKGGVFLSGTAFGFLVETGANFFLREKVYAGPVPLSLVIALLVWISSSFLLYTKTRNLKSDWKALKLKLNRGEVRKSGR